MDRAQATKAPCSEVHRGAPRSLLVLGRIQIMLLSTCKCLLRGDVFLTVF